MEHKSFSNGVLDGWRKKNSIVLGRSGDGPMAQFLKPAHRRLAAHEA
jgi:hypothetical protein